MAARSTDGKSAAEPRSQSPQRCIRSATSHGSGGSSDAPDTNSAPPLPPVRPLPLLYESICAGDEVALWLSF